MRRVRQQFYLRLGAKPSFLRQLVGDKVKSYLVDLVSRSHFHSNCLII